MFAIVSVYRIKADGDQYESTRTKAEEDKSNPASKNKKVVSSAGANIDSEVYQQRAHQWEDFQEIGSNPKIVDVAGRELGVPQILDTNHYDGILQKIEEARWYLREFISLNAAHSSIIDRCKNKKEQCGLWAVLGGKFMHNAVQYWKS